MEAPVSHIISLFACSECKSRKLRCDRQKPACGRCSKNGETCRYPTSRKRPVYNLQPKPKLSELEERLMELEEKLRAKEAAEQRGAPHTPESLPESSMSTTGRYEQLPPQSQIEELTNIYFSKLQVDMPMIHPQRYLASLYRPPHMQPPMCLQYAIMAVAATTTSHYAATAEAYYRRARHYLEADEMREDGRHLITVAHAQTWVLLSQFEAQNVWFARASMSTSRAVRLCQILGLHVLDAQHPGVNPSLPPPVDWVEAEERRRTFWAAFALDRTTSTTGSWPALMDVNRIQTRLPSSTEEFERGIPTKGPTLNQALTYTHTTTKSSFAHRIVASHLFHECYSSSYADAEFGGIDNDKYWSDFHRLNDGIQVACMRLPEHLQCPPNVNDPTAVLVNLQLNTATICLYRSASSHIRRSGMPPPIPIHTEHRVLPAAQAIVTIVALVEDVTSRFRNPTTAFAAFMAGMAFLRDWSTGSAGDPGSMDKTLALMDVMVDIGEENLVTASLAVHMAHELYKTGIDPGAMAKVSKLIEKMDLGSPLLGKEDGESGAVVLCPLEARFGPKGPHDGVF